MKTKVINFRKDNPLRPNVLQAWMLAATADEKQALAKRAKTTYGTLRQAAGAYRTSGALRLDADLARRLELAAFQLQRDGLPVLRREDMAPACAKCEFAKICRGL